MSDRLASTVGVGAIIAALATVMLGLAQCQWQAAPRQPPAATASAPASPPRPATPSAPWYQAGATRIMNGTLRDWYASDVPSFEREMAARGLTLAFVPHAEGRALDTLGRRMVGCIEREGIMLPPETRTRTVAARCALGMIEP